MEADIKQNDLGAKQVPAIQVLASWNYAPALLMLVYGLLLTIFDEKLPYNYGIGWDGQTYYSMVQALTASPNLDAYTVWRIFPAFLYHFILHFMGAETSPKNVILIYQFFNLFWLVWIVHTMRLIFRQLSIKENTQWLGFFLFMSSYCVTKFAFYYPVLTDVSAMGLAMSLLYLHLKKNIPGLFLASFVGSFCNPVIAPIGCLMMLLPATNQSFHVANSAKLKWAFRILFFSYYVLVSLYCLRTCYLGPKAVGCLAVDTSQANQSIIIASLVFSALPLLIINYDYWAYWKEQKASIFRAVFSVFAFCLVVWVIRNYYFTNLNVSAYVNPMNLFSAPILLTLNRPAIHLVSYGTFFGSVLFLVIMFWRRFCNAVFVFGPAPALALFSFLFLWSGITEPRVLSTVFPFVVVFLVVALNKLDLEKEIISLIVFVNVLTSKLWLPIHFDQNALPDANGSFANQRYWMNQGNWMSQYMYTTQFFLFVCILSLFLLLAFKIKLKNGTIEFYKAYPDKNK